MRNFIFATALCTAMSAALVASADQPRHRWVGFQTDVGAPDGATLGLVVRPYFDWVRLTGSGTYNGVAPGYRVGLTLDPMPWAAGLTLTAEHGQAFDGTVPVSTHPTVGYDYNNLHLGLEFGQRDVWRFFIHGGPTYISGHVGGFQALVKPSDNSITLGDRTFSGWVPSAKLGFTYYF